MLNLFLARNNKINKEEVKNNILDILIDVVTYYVVTHTCAHTHTLTKYIYIYIYKGIYIRFQNTSMTNGHHSMSIRNKIGKQNGFFIKSL